MSDYDVYDAMDAAEIAGMQADDLRDEVERLKGNCKSLANALEQLLKAVECSVCNGSGPAQDTAREALAQYRSWKS